ncbi:glycosyltransferase [Thermotoga petrophila]|uniref:glycosyltransferase n=1 Tax=Thermotoga petrophila TaxID=93929 RepID=UPI002FE2CE10|nr:glycosyl transferase group 1 [Thermotoga sp.]
MRLAYVAYIFFDKNLGVRKKLISQMKIFSKYFDSYLFTLEKNELIVYNGDWQVEKSILIPDVYLFSENDSFLVKVFKVLERTKWFFETVNRELKDFDITYIRAFLPVKEAMGLLKDLKKKNTKIIFEYPTYPFGHEFFKTYGPVFFLMYYPRYKRVNNLVDLIVTFGEKKGADSGKFITLSNGVDFSDIPLKKPAPDYDVLNLIGVARLRYWHGYDRVIKGLERYYRDNPEKKVYFHIVGDGPELPKLKRLTEELRMEEHVIFHGLKYGEELNRIFDIAHVAVASLGMHRSKLITGNTLKVREYCARGIPFIVGYRDVDFPEDFPFSLRVEPNDSPIDIQKVVSFYEKLKKNYPNHSLLMRKYAEEKLSWEAKMKPLIEKILNMR